jgi:hypothetical protein
MKTVIALASIMILVGSSSFAQSDKVQGLEKMQSGFVVAPEFKFSELDSESASLLGGRAGWLTDRKLFLGAGAYFLTSGPSESGLAYGGALVEWFAQRNDRFNLSFVGLLGAGTGTLAVDADDLRQGAFQDHGGRGGRFPHRFPSSLEVDEGFFVAEPQANASITFTNWMRLSVGAGYRLIGAASGLESRLRGPTASFSLQLGSFY